MKRLVISIAIIGVILSAGLFALWYIDLQNDRLLGSVEEVIAAYTGGIDANPSLARLERTASAYAKRLTAIADDTMLEELKDTAKGLSAHYKNGSPLFLAECGKIIDIAEEIKAKELPTLGRIL